MVRMKTMSNKISPGQCHNIGGQASDILFASNADGEKAQEVANSRNHPFWVAFNGLVQTFLVKAEEVKETILDWLSDLIIPTQPEFIVAEKFTKENPDVQFWYFGDNFKTWCMPMTEKAVGEATVSVSKLRIRATLAKMTPEQPAPRIVTASQIYWMLSQQPKGEKPNGKTRRLSVDGSANLFRVIDVNGEERAVYAGWDDGYGWGVDASVLEDDYQWRAGSRVISRK